MKVRNTEFDFKNKCYIMGILNVTPDSFSDGGKFNKLDAALKHTEEMIKDGASIIDVGGESTRPGHTQISTEEEIERVVPIIEGIRRNFDIPISIDCYRSETFIEAIKAGADILNDIWGLKYDEDMAIRAKELNTPVILMHNRKDENYKDFIQDMKSDLEESINLAKKAGISDDKIIIDPGIGFAKSYEQNLTAIKKLNEFHYFGYPILLAASRKRVVKWASGLDDMIENKEPTVATTVYGVINGAAIFRVHDVKVNYIAMKTAFNIKNEGYNGLYNN